MKKLTVLFIFIAGMILLPLHVNASIIGNVNLKLDASTPTGYVKIGTSLQNVYLDYDAKLGSETDYREAFCVENASAIDGSTNLYTLLTVDSGLANYGLTASKYLQAATVASYYFNTYEGTNNEETMKAATQLVIWEIMFETDAVFDLSSGYFQADVTLYGVDRNLYDDEALTIWNAVQNLIVPASTSEWVLAVNPTVSEGGTISTAPAQNYLVRYDVPQVPEPASLLLIGFGLLGLAGIRSRMKK